MRTGMTRNFEATPTGTRPALARAASPLGNRVPAAGWDEGSRQARVAGSQSDQEERI